MTEKGQRWLLFGVSALAVSLPFLVVTYPPSIDLPQHVAQVRLFSEALHHPDGPYRIQWFTPYSAVTLLFGAIWRLVGPIATGRIGLLAIGVLWTAAAHWIAARRQRPPEAAVLASMLFLGLSLYRGFCSFLLGWPVFLVWLELTTRPPRRWDVAKLVGMAVLLYFCHGLWFAVAMGWLLVASIVWRPPPRILAWRLGTLLPLFAGALIWWVRLDTAGTKQPMQWFHSPLARLSPVWFARASFGGLQGPVELVVFLLLLAWCGVAVWQHRRNFFQTVDRQLRVAAGLFLVGVVVLPTTVSFTFFFAERFAGPGVVLLLLALPAPVVRTGWIRAAAVGLVVIFCGLVANSWRLFEQTDLTGFTEAIEALPENPQVLGLDFLRTSAVIEGRPFTHQVAWAQVLKGGRLGYSFAEAPSALVAFKNPAKPWSRALEFYAERVQPSDLHFFDYVILAADEEAQAGIASRLPLTPVTTSGLWRLYKVQPPSHAGKSALEAGKTTP